MKLQLNLPTLARLSALAAGLMLISNRVPGAVSFPEPSQLPAHPALPDPLVMFDGTRVTTKDQWVRQRRPELKALFEHYMYGTPPAAPDRIQSKVERVDANCFGGKATRKQVTITFGPAGTAPIHVLLVVPNKRQKPAPVFVGLNFCGNHALITDANVPLSQRWMPRSCPGCVDNHATEASRGTQVDVWALEQSIDRGYAVASIYNGDIEPDRPEAAEGIRAIYAKAGNKSDWGTIRAWAWGLSRVVDYLVTDADLDAKRIAVVGHSRLGKTALVAAAFDERIALAIPLQAGCGGTSPSRGKIGESVQRINTSFPHWFNGEFKKFNEQPERLPFDQHCLIALCAPRPVLLANATEDTWANPAGQFEMLPAAAPVYRLLGTEGVSVNQMPEEGKLIDSTLGYYIRPGKHSMTKGDWKVFLDFADKHLGKPAR